VAQHLAVAQQAVEVLGLRLQEVAQLDRRLAPLAVGLEIDGAAEGGARRAARSRRSVCARSRVTVGRKPARKTASSTA
jgi:hypothetical protein